MPEEGVNLLPREDLLSFEEIARIVRVFASIGVKRVRLTGGEPTLRSHVADCVRLVKNVPGIEQVVMTTNGHRLPELANELIDAGLSQLNVSVDTLDAAKFAAITRRGDLGRVLAGIEAAHAIPLKLNVVALKGFNDGEVGALFDYAWQRNIVPRFIEWMPMSDGQLFAPGQLLAAAEIRTLVELHTGITPVPEDSASLSLGIAGPARYWRIGENRFGIISAMSEHFCDTCNRVRLTAVGKLHTCLAYDDATDLRSILRAGGSDDDLLGAIRDAVAGKRQGHDFKRDGCGGPQKHMVSIGG